MLVGWASNCAVSISNMPVLSHASTKFAGRRSAERMYGSITHFRSGWLSFCKMRTHPKKGGIAGNGHCRELRAKRGLAALVDDRGQRYRHDDEPSCSAAFQLGAQRSSLHFGVSESGMPSRWLSSFRLSALCNSFDTRCMRLTCQRAAAGCVHQDEQSPDVSTSNAPKQEAI